MPMAVFVDPRLDWQLGPNPLIEHCMSELRAFRCQFSDGRAEILNNVDWGVFLSPSVSIRLGTEEPEAGDSPAPTNTVKTETAASNPLNWIPVRATERLLVDESGTRPTEGLLVRVVEDLECSMLGGARILVLAATDERSKKAHCVIGLDSELVDDAGHWRDERLRDRYERFLSAVTTVACAPARVDLTQQQQPGSAPRGNIGISPALWLALDLDGKRRSPT